MALLFHPSPGDILICDYHSTVGAEMRKRRPVVVLSPNFKSRSGLCSVVPLSTKAPPTVMPYHHQLTIQPPLPAPYDSAVCWVKGDMFGTVSFERLELVRAEKKVMGKRTYLKPSVSAGDLQAIYCCVLQGLGLGRLTPHV